MGKKYDSLNHLVALGINVHDFELKHNLQELQEYEKRNASFSIRFDREEHYHQLPFYTYDRSSFTNEETKNAYLSNIAEEAFLLHCDMLCSNGHRYDHQQICNFVIRIEQDHTFTLEWSTQKVPLRNMYEYPTSCLTGQIEDNLKNMNWVNAKENPISEELLESILLWAMKVNVIGSSLEGTLYPIEVGIRKEKIACWQLD